jgi:hypothetical protein
MKKPQNEKALCSSPKIPPLKQCGRDVEAGELGERRRRTQAAGLDVGDLVVGYEVLRDVGGGEGECLRVGG